MAISEGDVGILEQQDFVVEINTPTPVTPAYKTYEKVAIFGTKTASGNDIKGVLCAVNDPQLLNIEEQSEISKFDGNHYFYNVAFDQDVLDDIMGKADVIIFLSGRSSGVFGYDFGNFQGPVIITVADNGADTDPATLNWNTTYKRNAFINIEKEPKLVYGYTHWLGRIEENLNVHQIGDPSFSGITSISEKNRLFELGFSFYVKTKNATWLHSWQHGKVYAPADLMENKFRYEIREALTRLEVNSPGLLYNNNTASEIEAVVNTVIKKMKDAGQINDLSDLTITSYSDQAADNKQALIWSGTSITYKWAGKTREIKINISKEY